MRGFLVAIVALLVKTMVCISAMDLAADTIGQTSLLSLRLVRQQMEISMDNMRRDMMKDVALYKDKFIFPIHGGAYKTYVYPLMPLIEGLAHSVYYRVHFDMLYKFMKSYVEIAKDVMPDSEGKDECLLLSNNIQLFIDEALTNKALQIWFSDMLLFSKIDNYVCFEYLMKVESREKRNAIIFLTSIVNENIYDKEREKFKKIYEIRNYFMFYIGDVREFIARCGQKARDVLLYDEVMVSRFINVLYRLSVPGTGCLKLFCDFFEKCNLNSFIKLFNFKMVCDNHLFGSRMEFARKFIDCLYLDRDTSCFFGDCVGAMQIVVSDPLMRNILPSFLCRIDGPQNYWLVNTFFQKAKIAKKMSDRLMSYNLIYDIFNQFSDAALVDIMSVDIQNFLAFLKVNTSDNDNGYDLLFSVRF